MYINVKDNIIVVNRYIQIECWEKYFYLLIKWDSQVDYR